MKNQHVERDAEKFPPGASYRVKRYSGIAWTVLGWETEPDADTEWTGQEERTGNVIAVMVGDDKKFSLDPDDLSPLKEEDFCRECGQIGCTADGRRKMQ